MSKNKKDFFNICPKCHIAYNMSNYELYDHLVECDGRYDIITTRFYTKEEFYKNKKENYKNKIIEPSVRPVTR